ncbi:hypothetical protein VOLCADRAFT_102948 [Volvox carteri f. nagariensis]|uniref:CBM20 domain-containing protein n=1 Tax=Volvox carteri f. nagariensis TaxID=3068 RepID=D8TIZ1_VOLCA|nr:uncharacterized protein VOLCADRAFT_102948 [Volvox carteri f. nagariensis]EFJ52450.1 hypothetical protein VOLCADRAFT_102948 [Volvox carteri f. nagariensis]|eukprot:XP_002946523.1 hypothetical protein VOLCADRAFT_102948 [Volvox carteri f. nagariensis]
MVQLSPRSQQCCGTAQRYIPLCRGTRSCIRSRAVRCFKGGADEISNKPNNPLRLNFKIPYRVNFGQSLGLVGSGDSLGNWDPKRTVQMKWTDGDWWTVELSISPGGALDLEYKYVVVNQDGNIGYWKPGSNYRVTLPLQPSGTKIPKRVKVADAWDDSFKKVDIEEAEVQAAGSSSNGTAGHAAAPKASSNGTPPPTQATGIPAATPQPAVPPVGSVASRAASPRVVPSNFAAATAIPVIHPSLMAEQERLEDGVRNSLEDLQAQMDKHQQLRERNDDPAAVEVLVADRIVAAANNRVVAYNKALKAVQEYNRLPPSASTAKEATSDIPK